MARMTFSDRELAMLALALGAFLEDVDGDYDDDHVLMEKLIERIRLVRLGRRSR